jgi:putative ABC transport system permease protein
MTTAMLTRHGGDGKPPVPDCRRPPAVSCCRHAAMKFLHLIWGNLKRKKLRTSLTLLSILVAFVLFGVLCAIKHALIGGVELAGADRLVVRHKVSIIQLLPESYKARMARIPGVSLAVHQTWFGGIYQDPKNFFMQCPVEPEDFLKMFPEFRLPPEQLKAWLATRTGAIAGRNTVDRFGWKIGDKIPIMSPIWLQRTWEFDLVGIFEGRDKGTDTTPLFFRYDYFDEVRKTRNWGTGLVGWYTIRVEDPARAAEVARLIDQEFENSPAETKTEPEGAFVQAFANQIGDIALIVAGILGAVFFTILLVTGSTMSQAVRERIGELGVLKAIGFTNGQVLGLVLAESCLLALLGGGLGLGLAALFISRGDPTGGLLPLFHFPASDLLIGAGIAVVLGVLTGVFPALQATRLRVADALRRM